MPHLFDPLTIRSITLRNRIGVSPMCEYSSNDGFASDWHLVHLGSRAVGGASLVIAEATAVEARGRITPGCLGIWKDEHVEMLARITKFIRSQGAVPGMQIAHAGRKASCAVPWESGKALRADQGAWETLAPSAIPFHQGDPAPHAMTIDEIKTVQSAFVAAAKRARAAGFQFLEVHGAHGYLAHEFYSPLANHRADAYGGSFENRTRFIVETTKAVRQAWGDDLPLSVRLSCSDWIEGAWSIDDSVKLASLLRDAGADMIDCSSGGNASSAKIPVGPGYQVPFAERIRKEAKIATAAVGLITTPSQAEEIIATDRADVVLLAREMLRDPYFALHAIKSQSGPEALVPKQYTRAF